MVNYTSGCLRRLENGDFKGSELVRAMESVVEAASRGSEIVRHLREFVRKGQTRRERFDLNEAVDEVLSLVVRKARQDDVELELSAEDRPLMVEANRIQIEQVVLNLVMNAVEAVAGGPGDGARVEVSSRAAPEGPVGLVVRDNGPGSGKDHAEALFSPSKKVEYRAGLQRRFAGLRPREREVMALVIQGRPNKVIADELGVSIKTVELHRGNVMSKVAVGSSAELARLAVLAGIELN